MALVLFLGSPVVCHGTSFGGGDRNGAALIGILSLVGPWPARVVPRASRVSICKSRGLFLVAAASAFSLPLMPQ